MSLIEEGIVAKIKTVNGITAIIGTGVNARISPGVLPQNETLPAITYSKISGVRVQIMGGISGLAHPVYQINSWASTYLAAKALAEQVRLGLDANIATTWGSITIRASIMDDDSDLLEVSPDLKERRRYGIRQDFEVWHDEATS